MTNAGPGMGCIRQFEEPDSFVCFAVRRLKKTIVILFIYFF